MSSDRSGKPSVPALVHDSEQEETEQMSRTRLTLAALATAALAGCAREAPVEPAPVVGAARADVRDAGGRLLANASAEQAGDRVRVRIEAAGLAPGSYGAHIHAVGRCDAPGFDSAGPHWNPTLRQHGTQNPQGAHLGDLPNLLVGANGQGSFEISLPASLAGGAAPLLDGDGATLVIHASADDYRTDPSGNSGARIGCGVFG